MTNWIVQTDTLCDNWINCWDEGKCTFETLADARKEIYDHLANVKEAVEAGDMAEEYDPNDYRAIPDFLGDYTQTEVHPCRIDSISPDGKQILEQTSEDADDIAVWTVYGHKQTGGLEWICDCETKEVAESIADIFDTWLRWRIKI